jgi:catechol 2,3-dioxygenase-like lactoylglutathione lyase family enzyme
MLFAFLLYTVHANYSISNIEDTKEISMFKDTKAFSGFSVDDIPKAKDFYNRLLGIEVSNEMGGLLLHIAGSNPIFVYPKADHTPATFTILNFPVKNIDSAAEELKALGIEFEHYDGEYIKTDEHGIARGEKDMGPSIAWFKDPAGNILSVLEEQ